MTKKHLEAIAAILRDLRKDAIDADSRLQRVDSIGFVDKAIHWIATYCAESNGSFDENRFYRACGMEV